MAAYNFKKEFAAAVESGRKKQTIRADRKDGRRPKPGEILALYTGMRTKACRLLLRAPCKTVCTIEIFHDRRGADVIVDGLVLNKAAVRELAHADGFVNENSFFYFFEENHGSAFVGILVTW